MELKWFPKYVQSGVAIVLVFSAIALLSKWTSTSKTDFCSPKVQKKLKHLLDEAGRWYKQGLSDSNTVHKLMHATYALAYVNTALQIVTPTELEDVTNVRVDELQAKYGALQQDVIKTIGQQYPSLMPEGSNAVYTGYLV
jgi:hypothetical protein